LSSKIKQCKKKSCKGFCQRIQKSAGMGSGTQGVLSYTWLVSFQCGASCRLGLNVV